MNTDKKWEAAVAITAKLACSRESLMAIADDAFRVKKTTTEQLAENVWQIVDDLWKHPSNPHSREA